MKKGHLLSIGILCAAATASASDLNLNIQSGGSNSIKTTPGATVTYSVAGILGDNQNEGLALFCFDLSFSGGPLSPANAPTSNPMLNFASPLGINNPAGFGGTPIAGKLIQIGGGQNTFLNPPSWLLPGFPPVSVVIPPAGQNVLTGVGQPGSPATLVTGTLAAPYKVGSYTLSAGNLIANVIRQGETGTPFWHVDPADGGILSNLTIEVEALSADKNSVSAFSGEKQTLTLDAGPANAGRSYLLLGSMSGTSPGITLHSGLVLPLNFDGYFSFTLQNPNSGPLTNSLGLLNGQGKATAAFMARPRLIGATLHHAYFLSGPIDFVSNPVSVTVTP